MSFCPKCSRPLDQRAVVCPHCGYDFPPPPPAPPPEPTWSAVAPGLLWVVCGVALVFLGEGRPSDGCLAAFAVAAGLYEVFRGVRPWLGPDAARLAGRASVACGVLATAAAAAGLWLGVRDAQLVPWLVLVGGVAVVWAGRLLARRRRAAADRPDA